MTRDEKVLEAVREVGPVCTVDELAAHVGTGRRTVQRALARLVQAGRLQRSAMYGGPSVYRVVR